MKNGGEIKRILLKLSGETLMGSKSFGIHFDSCEDLAKSLKEIRDAGLEVGIVIGGGNIFRGINLKNSGIERTPADHMGMLATLMNGIALKQALKLVGCPATVMSALPCPKVAEPYNWEHATQLLEQGHITIFVGGTGNPYFTTDTAAALRASEIQADLLLKATKVDGVYTKDPVKFPDAEKYDTISYSQALTEKLGIMDSTAIALCRSNQIPILVFDMGRLSKENIKDIISRKDQGGSLIKKN